MQTLLIAGTSDRVMPKTISSQASIIYRRRFNDYPKREYTQVSGNGEYLFIKRDSDIVSSVWKHTAVHKRTHID